METSHELLLHLIKWSLVQIMGIAITSVWIIILFDNVYKYGNGAEFWGYVGTNAEPLSVKLCNFVQCHIFLNYLTSYIKQGKKEE
jgi:hypothetical protein